LEASTFRCLHCRQDVPTDPFGTAHRNHCPLCLWSRHLDVTPGDRRSNCGSRMEPVAVALRRGGEWALIHRCLGCGVLHENRIAGDDSIVALMAIAAAPLANPPVPVDFARR
jgi:hypothetical protein